MGVDRNHPDRKIKEVGNVPVEKNDHNILLEDTSLNSWPLQITATEMYYNINVHLDMYSYIKA